MIPRKLLFLALALFLAACFAIAIYPEPAAKILTDHDRWDIDGPSSSKVSLSSFPPQFSQVRRSAFESPGGVLFRTWTPDRGVVPIEVTSPPFRPARYMSVAITGTNRTPGGHVYAALECQSNKQKIEVFRGSVNVNVAEAIVPTPKDWCPGDAQLRLVATEQDVNVGVGAVFEISRLSFLKSSFVGRVPYLVLALTVFGLLMAAGASIAVRLGWYDHLLPASFISLALGALGAFYLASAIPIKWRWAGAVFVATCIVVALLLAGREARHRSFAALAPYARVWGVASLVYFSILALVTNGVGHWEPNYRFWPATWSSDNELPWLVAEAIRRGWDLQGLFGGAWLPTDRPPLMAGAHLLLADVFGLLQSRNDGVYLRGQAYNATAVVLNSLWVPACAWLLAAPRSSIDHHGRAAILFLIGCLPFVLFNTVYGWPKFFGAAFALLAFAIAWQVRERQDIEPQSRGIVLFFALGAFSMLAHASTALFLMPLGLLFLWWTARRNQRGILAGFAISLALVASWSVYKAAVLPSGDPVTKFALTGDYGFGHPGRTVWEMLWDRYGGLDFWQWIQIKKIMFLQSFLPVDHSITQVHMNADFGAGVMDRLRAWDVLMLSKGNSALWLLVIAAGWASLKAFAFGHLDEIRADAAYLVVVGISLVAWLLMVLGFLAPVVIPVWPQAALLGLTLGGAAIVYRRCRGLFAITLAALAAYTGLVWMLSPLQAGLHIDIGAGFVLMLLCSYVAVQGFLGHPT